jgi:GDP/UDP-N,N'-diacetylbacillosamine 2-epimerase (hydrolysing)
MPYVVMTYHPVTLEDNTVKNQIEQLLDAINCHPGLFFIITAANADAGGDEANRLMKSYADTHDNALFVISLGMIRYLSAVKYAAFVLGNSSSGILEAPVLGTPTVNIGDRQKGRLQAESILDVDDDSNSIIMGMDKAMRMPHKSTNMYGDGSTSGKIVTIIKDYLLNDKIDLKKTFYDME